MAVGDGDAVGVGLGERVAVGEGEGEVVAATPVPGQVCDKRIPELDPLVCAKDPACTILILSCTGVYV